MGFLNGFVSRYVYMIYLKKMASKLTLTLDSEIIFQAKAYAKSTDRSLS